MIVMPQLVCPPRLMNPRSATATGGSTLSLNHFDGTDGATTTTDEVAGVLWEITNGQLDTGVKKFGTASFEYGDVTTTGFLLLGASNWTVEGFVRLDDGGSVSVTWSSAEITTRINAVFDEDLDVLNVELTDAGNDTFYAAATSPTILHDTWYHFAIVKEGTTYSVYFDGVRQDTTTSASNIENCAVAVQSLTISRSDEFRISQTARYTGATYTVPAAAFTVD